MQTQTIGSIRPTIAPGQAASPRRRKLYPPLALEPQSATPAHQVPNILSTLELRRIIREMLD